MSQPHSTRALLALFTLTAFVVAPTIHYQTPALAAIAADLGATTAEAGWIPALSFGGLFAGIALLVPLGDRLDRRTLVLVKLGVLWLAQVAMFFAPSIMVLAIASLVTGIASALIQHLIGTAAETAAPNERGRAVGTVFSALFLGILFARIGGGFIADHFGWRWNYALSVVLIAVLAPVLAGRFPHTRPTTSASYFRLLGSVFGLMREHGEVRRIAAMQFMLGICYGGFWAVLAPMMAALHRVGPTEAGLIGIPGAAGLLVARPAGRLMDRVGATPVVTAGIGTIVVGWLVFGFAIHSVLAVVLGVILLDCGLRATMVANQTLVNARLPQARARANSIFGMHVWGGNAVGAWLATTAFTGAGWLAVCALALVMSSGALALHLVGTRQERRTPP